ncbi:sortase [Candidatus Saccharibacteria bacterium]|nr:sortase [Candidatus Saccharibacteria bacterium]
MGSVITRSRFSREKKIYLTIFLTYFVAAFVFLTIGLQPIKNSEAVYASEAESAINVLSIDSISLSAPVKAVMLNGKTLEVPEQIAGAYSVYNNKTLIIGHSSTIFANLKNVKLGEKISYNGKEFTINDIREEKKEDIIMKDILREETTDTVILMTCSGEKIEGTSGDHTHRLIITAN